MPGGRGAITLRRRRRARRVVDWVQDPSPHAQEGITAQILALVAGCHLSRAQGIAEIGSDHSLQDLKDAIPRTGTTLCRRVANHSSEGCPQVGHGRFHPGRCRTNLDGGTRATSVLVVVAFVAKTFAVGGPLCSDPGAGHPDGCGAVDIADEIRNQSGTKTVVVPAGGRIRGHTGNPRRKHLAQSRGGIVEGVVDRRCAVSHHL
mmetsp:Transcript_16617/g.41637  ORF Transcript_16617/g.41637 Transcript_16617/m.41637 type:complete len:204 (+) Transcript_16617:587-1198(+)